MSVPLGSKDPTGIKGTPSHHKETRSPERKTVSCLPVWSNTKSEFCLIIRSRFRSYEDVNSEDRTVLDLSLSPRSLQKAACKDVQ
jgi:hypothetical protein